MESSDTKIDVHDNLQKLKQIGKGCEKYRNDIARQDFTWWNE